MMNSDGWQGRREEAVHNGCVSVRITAAETLFHVPGGEHVTPPVVHLLFHFMPPSFCVLVPSQLTPCSFCDETGLSVRDRLPCVQVEMLMPKSLGMEANPVTLR